MFSLDLSAISIGESLVFSLLQVSGFQKFNKSSKLHLALRHELALVAQIPIVCVTRTLAKSVWHCASFAVSVAHASTISILHALFCLQFARVRFLIVFVTGVFIEFKISY